MGRSKNTTEEVLAQCRREYEALKSEIAEIGYVMQGSVVRRTKQCGQPGCQCHQGPEYEHGPYYQWTRKIKAKTVTAVLTPAEARTWQEFIRNGRRLKKLVARMYALSARAAKHLGELPPS